MKTISPKFLSTVTLALFVFALTALFVPSLYAQTIERLESVKLNIELLSTGRVSDFQISPDGEMVVFVARIGTGRSDVLYSVPIAGGTPTPLTTEFSGRDVYGDFKITPDSQRVVFRGDLNALNLDELFSVPIEGGSIQRLNADLVLDGDVIDFEVSNDSNWVVYLADLETNSENELFSVPIIGGASKKLNPDFSRSGFHAIEYKISPSSDRVVFRFNPDDPTYYELFSVPIDDGAITKLDGSLFNNLNTDISQVFEFIVTPNGQQVVYRARQHDISLVQNELYSVPIDGGISTRITPEQFTQSNFQVSPDSSRVIYNASDLIDGLPGPAFSVFNLYSVSTSGGLIANLTSFDENQPDSVLRFNLDNPSQRVIYQLNDSIKAAFSIPFLGGNRIQLNDPPNQAVQLFRISESNSLYAYTNGIDLNLTPIAGGTTTKVNTEPNTFGVPNAFEFDPFGEKIAYTANSEVYIRDLASGTIYLGNDELVTNGGVFNYQINASSKYLVYRADQDVDNKLELYSVEIPESLAEEADEMCLPISAKNGSIAVVCL